MKITVISDVQETCSGFNFTTKYLIQDDYKR